MGKGCVVREKRRKFVSMHTLRPWTDLAKLHPEVEAGALTELVSAIDLGTVAANDPNIPKFWGPNTQVHVRANP
jgi:hypothetical protein